MIWALRIRRQRGLPAQLHLIAPSSAAASAASFVNQSSGQGLPARTEGPKFLALALKALFKYLSLCNLGSMEFTELELGEAGSASKSSCQRRVALSRCGAMT